MVIGSGYVIHNLFAFEPDKDAPPREWAVRFRDWIREKVVVRDIEALCRYETLAPYASLAVPRPEHFVPLLIALGSGSEERPVRVLYDTIEHGTGSTLSFQF